MTPAETHAQTVREALLNWTPELSCENNARCIAALADAGGTEGT